MTMESKIEAMQNLIEEVKAELAAMRAEKAAPPRNWPERIEAGMVFRVNGESMMVPNGKPVSYVIALTGENVGMSHYGWESAPGIEYLGHARDILTIRTDAHEPTGAELVPLIPDGAEWVEGCSIFYKGKWPNMRIWSHYTNEPKHWCEAPGSHEKYMTPISEWFAK